MICIGVKGDTSSCSTVPRSFSRTSAAAGNNIATIVIIRNRCEMDWDHVSFWS